MHRASAEVHDTMRSTYMAMSTLARRRGNYIVADNMKNLSWDMGSNAADPMVELERKSNALKIYLAKARDPYCASNVREEAMSDALKLVNGADTPMLEESNGTARLCAALKRFLALSGEVYSLRATDVGCSEAVHRRLLGGCTPGPLAKEKFVAALALRESAGAREDDAVDTRALKRKDAKVHFAFARFCDGQISSLPNAKVRKGRNLRAFHRVAMPLVRLLVMTYGPHVFAWAGRADGRGVRSQIC